MKNEIDYINDKINENIEVIVTYKAKRQLDGELNYSEETILKMAQDELKVLQSIWSHVKFRELYKEHLA